MLETLPARRLLSAELSAEPLLADFNADGRVDRADLAILIQHFGHAGAQSDGDATADGLVDSKDFDALAREFAEPVDASAGAHGKLIFSDEFVGKHLDPVWTTSQYWWPDDHTTVGKGELETYDATGVKVRGGMLHLTARPDETHGSPYISGLVQTGGKQDHPDSPRFSFLYGYMKVRAKIPAGKGLFPAIWLMPASHNDDNGEMDVMEAIGSDPGTVSMTVHRSGRQQGHDFTGDDLSAGFHTFAVDWRPDHITWFVDGVARATCTDLALICPEASYPILNLAVGGAWPGNPDASTRFPASMDVDYVRVYQ